MVINRFIDRGMTTEQISKKWMSVADLKNCLMIKKNIKVIKDRQ